MQLAFPLIVTFISHVVMGVADTLVMGRVGTAQQGGVGLGASLLWTMISFSAGLLSAVTTFVAQSMGAGKFDRIRHSVMAGLWVTAPLSLLLVVSGFGVPGMIRLMGTNDEAAPHVIVYLRYMLWASPLFLVNFTFISFFRGIADTVTPMVITLAVNVVNILLNVIFVFGYLGFPRMGVHGVAAATIASMGLSVITFAILFFSRRLHGKYSTRMRTPFADIPFSRFLKVGVPIGVSWFLEAMAFNIMALYIARFNPAGTAANTIVFQLCHVSFMPALAISIAASTLTGKYTGARKPEVARKSANRSIGMAIIYMGTLGLFFFLFPSFFIGLFSSDPDVLMLGTMALRLAAGFQIFDAMGMAVDGVFRGVGLTVLPMIIRLTVMWAIFVPGIFILGHCCVEKGILAGWTAALIGLVVQGTALLVAFFLVPWWKRKPVGFNT